MPGANAYIKNPFDIDHITEKVKAVNALHT